MTATDNITNPKIGALKRAMRQYLKNVNGGTHSYGEWYCGITNSTDIRKARHRYDKGNIKHWNDWDADSLENAHALEVFFSAKGTQNKKQKGGAKQNSKYVYIFKVPKTKYGLGGTVVTLDGLIDFLFA